MRNRIPDLGELKEQQRQEYGKELSPQDWYAAKVAWQTHRRLLEELDNELYWNLLSKETKRHWLRIALATEKVYQTTTFWATPKEQTEGSEDLQALLQQQARLNRRVTILSAVVFALAVVAVVIRMLGY